MKRNVIIYCIIFIVACILVFNHFFYDPSAREAVILTELNDLQKETLSTIKEMTNLLISLSSALFGLIGYFAFENYKSKGIVEDSLRIDLTLAFCATVISIDFGYIFMEKWVELLANGIFQPYDKLITIPQKLQLFSFLIALAFTGRIVYKNIFKSNKS